jgi:protoporphyrinogen oxidase
MRVGVLGGGIAGILTARMLAARGYDVHVFEAAPRIGGLCRSEVVDGFVYDLAGGHILHSRDAGVLGDMVAALGDPVECRRDTKIYYHGRFVKYPFENGLADLPPSDKFDCLKGYIDAHIARLCGAAEPDNFRDWIAWRFGDGMARHFMYPYNEKIWCTDLASVSAEWCSGRVPEAPLDDVIRAALGLESEGYTHQLTFYYPRRGGFESLVRAFAKGLEKHIRTSTPVREVVAAGRGFQVNGERFDRIVNTMPLKALVPVLRPAPPTEVRESLALLDHLSLTTVLVAVDKPDLSPYTWVYFPHADNGPMNRITYAHNYSPENAPEGCSSILAEVTSMGGGPRPDGDVLEREVVASLERLGLLEADWVRFTRSSFTEYAYPVHGHGFRERLARVLAWLDGRGIPSVGRFARYAYVNTDQVYMMVRETVDAGFPSVR